MRLRRPRTRNSRPAVVVLASALAVLVAPWATAGAAAAPAAPVAVPVAAVGPPAPLYPDLKVLPPRDLRFDSVNVSPEPGVTTIHKVLQFSNTTYNDGDGPLDLRATIDDQLDPPAGQAIQRVWDSAGGYVDYPVGVMTYHAVHQHYHFDGWGKYELWTAQQYNRFLASGRTEGSPKILGSKTTSCVLDEEFILTNPATTYPGTYSGAGCQQDANGTLHEGLSPGWGDTYDWYRFEQWIDLGAGGDLADGDYVLRSVADLGNVLYESPGKADSSREGATANEATTRFTVSGGQLLDQLAPSGTVAINDVDTSTPSSAVTVSVLGRDDVSGVQQFRLSNDGTTWKTFPYRGGGSLEDRVPWDLSDPAFGGTGGNGLKTVYAQFRDYAGRWGLSVSDGIQLGQSPVTSSYADSVLADGPVGYWRLGEAPGAAVARDATAAHPGSYGGAPGLGAPGLLSGDPDSAARFAGAGYVSVPDGSGLSPSTLSLEAWVSPTSLPVVGQFASVVSKTEGYALQFNGPLLEFTVIQNGVRNRLQAPAGAVPAGRSSYVAATLGGGAQRLYVNGALVASAPLDGAPSTVVSPLVIGSWDGSFEMLNGTIDEVAVYATALSAAQIGTHRRAGQAGPPPSSPPPSSPPPSSPPPSSPPPSGTDYASGVLQDSPIGYWRLGESPGAAAAVDSTGAHPGTYAGSPSLGAPGLLTGDADTAAAFVGAGSVGVPDAPGLNPAELSVEAWVSPTSLPASGAFASVLSKPEAYALQFNGPLMELTIMQGGVRHRLQAPTGAVPAGQTSHVVGTYGGGAQRLYVNGALVASASLSGAPAGVAYPLTIGSWDGSSELFSGTIDEAAVYGRALTAAQIAAHHANGVGGPPPSSPPPSSPPPSSPPPASPPPSSPPPAGSTYASTVIGDGPVAFWRLGEAPGASIAADAAGDHAGAYAGATGLGAPGLLADDASTAAEFAGAGSVQVPDGPGLSPSSLSLEAWISPTALPGPGQFASVVSKAESYALQFNGPLMELTIMQGGVRHRLQAPAGAVPTGETSHVVGTLGGGVQRLYVNGTLVASAALNGIASVVSNPLFIGSWDGSSELFSGTIDEVAVYGSALTPTQVSAHHAVGQPGSTPTTTPTPTATPTPSPTPTATPTPSPTPTATPSYAVTTSTSGTGSGVITSSPAGISCPPTCAASFPASTSVMLSQVAASGSTFAGWSGACSGTASTCRFSSYAATSADAAFGLVADHNELTVTPGGDGSGVVTSSPAGISCGSSCSASFPSSTSVTLTAASQSGSRFVGWAGACAGTGACTVSMASARAVSATFQPDTTYALALTLSGSGGVTSSPSGLSCTSSCSVDFPAGTLVTLTASPDNGRTFRGWSGACRGTSTCVVRMDQTQKARARFT